MLQYSFVKKPETFLLGITRREIKRKDFKLFQYAITAARTLTAQRWKQEQVPTLDEWRNKLIDYAELDKLTGKIRLQRDHKFLEDWGKFREYLKTICEENTTLVCFKEAL